MQRLEVAGYGPVLAGVLIVAAQFSLAGAEAVAGTITYSGQAVDLGAMGFGHVPPVLSVESVGAATIEWGQVSWDGEADVLTGERATSPGSETMSVEQLLAEGITRTLFGIVLNINEDVDRYVTIQDFSLDVYSSGGGASLFSVALADGPWALSSAGRGQGQAGYLFLVNLSETEWSTYFSGATSNRVGMTVPASGPILDVADGAESFTVAPVPEPATLAALAVGALAVIGRRRK